MKDNESFEQRSRSPWFSMDKDGITSEQIGVGCLQRIATAMESLNRSWCSVQEQNVSFRLQIAELKNKKGELERKNHRLDLENKRLKKAKP